MVSSFGVQWNICRLGSANNRPQANPVESVHRVLQITISAYPSHDQHTCDKVLAKDVPLICSAHHEAADLTTNFIANGKKFV